MATKQIKRRSIVEFEKWLDDEIEHAEFELTSYKEQAALVAHTMAEKQIKLDTLRGVKERVAITTPEEDEGKTLMEVFAQEDDQPTLDLGATELVEARQD